MPTHAASRKAKLRNRESVWRSGLPDNDRISRCEGSFLAAIARGELAREAFESLAKLRRHVWGCGRVFADKKALNEPVMGQERFARAKRRAVMVDAPIVER